MAIPKEWNHAVADEPWKVVICAAEVRRADDLISNLGYILTEYGADTAASARAIAEMSGQQIMDAILKYKDANMKAIKSGMK